MYQACFLLSLHWMCPPLCCHSVDSVPTAYAVVAKVEARMGNRGLPHHNCASYCPVAKRAIVGTYLGFTGRLQPFYNCSGNSSSKDYNKRIACMARLVVGAASTTGQKFKETKTPLQVNIYDKQITSLPQPFVRNFCSIARRLPYRTSLAFCS